MVIFCANYRFGLDGTLHGTERCYCIPSEGFVTGYMQALRYVIGKM